VNNLPRVVTQIHPTGSRTNPRPLGCKPTRCATLLATDLVIEEKYSQVSEYGGHQDRQSATSQIFTSYCTVVLAQDS